MQAELKKWIEEHKRPDSHWQNDDGTPVMVVDEDDLRALLAANRVLPRDAIEAAIVTMQDRLPILRDACGSEAAIVYNDYIEQLRAMVPKEADISPQGEIG